jgi:DNA topoisomerase IA
LNPRDQKIYNYITANFLACISQDATYEAVRAEMVIGDEVFKMKG